MKLARRTHPGDRPLGKHTKNGVVTAKHTSVRWSTEDDCSVVRGRGASAGVVWDISLPHQLLTSVLLLKWVSWAEDLKSPADWREGRRRRAWELKQAGRKQRVAARNHIGSSQPVLTRARADGSRGLRAHPASGPAEAHPRTACAAARPARPWSRGVWLSRPGLDVQAGGGGHPAHLWGDL
jgi:hypothetical protein